jgi:glutamate-1-semialdehyde aminotransferase
MSMARIIFSRKKISDRVQRDFFESKKIKKIEYFKKYLFKKKIYYPKNGILFLSYSLKHKDLNYTIQTIKKALNLFFK